MKTLERINVYETRVIIGYLDSESENFDISDINLVRTEMTEEQQVLTDLCVQSLQDTLEPNQTLKRSLMQITFEQHMCNERIIIWFTTEGIEDEEQKIYPLMSMKEEEEDKVKYNDFKSMCNEILQSQNE